MENQFGVFINKRRNEKQISLRSFSSMIGISPEYLSKIENGLRSAPKGAVVKRISEALVLNDDEQEILFDLAASSKSSPTVAGDLVEYIMNNEIVHQLLRFSKRYNVSDDDFQLIMDMLREKYV
ncbi:helix-turn-helix domain-containing protein [Ruminococcus intestinalis]|uniref:helix-turn-helix domain-containing protein n=1 Tax=Ruminococcus intestinalis TaxID=2763066 RepID=UPI003F81F7ED